MMFREQVGCGIFGRRGSPRAAAKDKHWQKPVRANLRSGLTKDQELRIFAKCIRIIIDAGTEQNNDFVRIHDISDQTEGDRMKIPTFGNKGQGTGKHLPGGWSDVKLEKMVFHFLSSELCVLGPSVQFFLYHQRNISEIFEIFNSSLLDRILA